jgi:hypothetical protein
MKPGCSSALILQMSDKNMVKESKARLTDLRFSSACLLVSVFASRVDSIQVRTAATSMAANKWLPRPTFAGQPAGLFLVIPSGWGRRGIVHGSRNLLPSTGGLVTGIKGPVKYTWGHRDGGEIVGL